MAVIVALSYGLMALAGTWTPRLGLDLRGGTTITLTARPTDGSSSIPGEKLEEARRIIQQRVDGLGVGEAVVTTQGDQHIEIAVPGVQQDELVRMVGTTAQLAFRAVYGYAPVNPEGAIPGLPKKPAEPRPAQTPPAEEPSFDTLLAWQPGNHDLDDFDAYSCKDQTEDVATRALVTCNQEGTEKYLLGPMLITGTSVTDAAAFIPANSINYVVSLSFDADGSDRFFKATSQLYSKSEPQNRFAIVLDSKVVSAPAPRGPISGGAEISGGFNLQSATALANILKYGALPLAFDVSQVETISATLGGEQLSGGIIAGIIGLVLVIAYGFIYYRALGAVVVGSLAAAAILTYSSMVLLGEAVGFALNLPGIAGAIVAIGLTADSFIIYFERIRDEIREGRNLRTAIETGWRRARSTIVISDMVSLLSAVVLFFLAVGGVRGFAFTLGLTTLIDLAVVFWFTKPVMTLLGRTRFFGEGRKWSGLDPDHMGVSRTSLLGRRVRSSKPVPKEA